MTTALTTHATTATEREASPPLLRFTEVGKHFRNGTLALDRVSLEFHEGEFVSVVGPSGCGKSTLLRIASGLSSASKGRIEKRFSSLGYVFQDATLLPWRTVAGNVELLMQLHAVEKGARSERASRAIELVGLGGFEGHYPKTLSGGMAMRTSLARSLTMEPDLFLFDEPFGALDAITRERLNDELLRLYESQSFTGVFVTHSISEAVYLSSRVVVMSGRPGRVVAEHRVPFAYPRSPELRFDPRFLEVSHAVSSSMRGDY